MCIPNFSSVRSLEHILRCFLYILISGISFSWKFRASNYKKKRFKMCSNEQIELQFATYTFTERSFANSIKNTSLNWKKHFFFVSSAGSYLRKKQLVLEKRNPVSVLWHGVESSGKAGLIRRVALLIVLFSQFIFQYLLFSVIRFWFCSYFEK